MRKLGNMASVAKAIGAWLKAKVEQAGVGGVVVGLSGGVDSAVAATLAVRALGKDAVFGLILPCESDPEDKEDAISVARKLGIRYRLIDMVDHFAVFDSRVDAENMTWADPKGTTLVRGNLKSRLRMVMLYTYANMYNYLVLGTGNLTEIKTGYFTKYGDGGVDLEPLGDLYKTDVWNMAKFLELPKQIISKPPSAGLWKGQTDEDDFGMPYAELDEAVDANLASGELGEGATEAQCTANLLYKRSEHKRHVPPICMIPLELIGR
jgi:NAD+ synthase